MHYSFDCFLPSDISLFCVFGCLSTYVVRHLFYFFLYFFTLFFEKFVLAFIVLRDVFKFFWSRWAVLSGEGRPESQ